MWLSKNCLNLQMTNNQTGTFPWMWNMLSCGWCFSPVDETPTWCVGSRHALCVRRKFPVFLSPARRACPVQQAAWRGSHRLRGEALQLDTWSLRGSGHSEFPLAQKNTPIVIYSISYCLTIGGAVHKRQSFFSPSLIKFDCTINILNVLSVLSVP